MVAKKNKKDVKQFKQALLSNTGFIKEIESVDNSSQSQHMMDEELIDKAVREKFQILAKYEGVEEKELLHMALNHFLKLKGLQLKQALKQKSEH